MEQFLSQHWYQLAIPLGVLILIVLVGRRVLAERELAAYGADLTREMRRRVLEKAREGDDLAVAGLLFDAEAYDAAAELFNRLSLPMRAAECYERAGKVGMAVQAFKRAGQNKRAARLAFSAGMFSIAGKELDELGELSEAAEAFLKAGKAAQAADLYRRNGNYKQAGELYDQLRRADSAIEMYVTYFDEQLRLARGDAQSIGDAREVAKRVAQLHHESGDPDAAAKILERAAFLVEAAHLYQDAGAYERAAECFLKAGDAKRAATLLEQLGRTEEAAVARAKTFSDQGDKRSAAEQLALAGQGERAAELYLEIDDLESAAIAYEEADDHVGAGELWLRLENLERAAECFAQSNDLARAAHLAEEVGQLEKAGAWWKAAGNYAKAAANYTKAGQHQVALELLARVDEGSDLFWAARTLEGRILLGMGRTDEALSRFEAGTKGEAPDQRNAELYYWMGRCAEALGRREQAADHYRAVLSAVRGHAEARKRLKGLGAPERPPKARAAAGGPQPAGAPGADKAIHPRFRLEEEIARGGMGVVYLAQDTVLKRQVAVKVLSDNLETNETAVEYFLREARSAAQMSHPNIVTVYDAGEHQGVYYIVMEYVEGETLKGLIKRRGAFPEKLVRYVAQQACHGLAYAHKKGLVHRDIKSANLMLTKERSIKIMDFGLAKFTERSQYNHTKAIGTPYYISPEQILGKELDGRSDIYSLGITLFECATGNVPFARGELSYHHLHTPAPEARSWNPEISHELSAIIDRCIAKRPEERYQSARKILAALKTEAAVKAV